MTIFEKKLGGEDFFTPEFESIKIYLSEKLLKTFENFLKNLKVKKLSLLDQVTLVIGVGAKSFFGKEFSAPVRNFSSFVHRNGVLYHISDVLIFIFTTLFLRTEFWRYISRKYDIKLTEEQRATSLIDEVQHWISIEDERAERRAYHVRNSDRKFIMLKWFYFATVTTTTIGKVFLLFPSYIASRGRKKYFFIPFK